MEEIKVDAYGVAFGIVGDRTLRMTPKQYRLHVQWRFIETLRSIRYFQNVVEQELRPLWGQMGEISRDTYSFRHLPLGSSYVSAVDRLVSKRMNCLVNGESAQWVQDAIHLTVVRRPELTIGSLEPVGFVRQDLSIAVNTVGMAEVLRIQHTGEGEEDEEVNQLFDQPYAAFDDWDELRRLAHAQVDELLESVKAYYLEVTEGHLNIRPSKLQQISDGNMRSVIAWLWPEVGAKSSIGRDTRRRLLDDLGLDPVTRAASRKK